MKTLVSRSAWDVRKEQYRRYAGLLASLVLAISALVIIPASPAMAGCARTFLFGGAQVQIDNCPGNGAASWGWVYGSPDYSWTDVYVRFPSGTELTLTAGSGTANTANWYEDVSTVAICNTKFFSWLPPAPIIHCSERVPV
ncbi:MULTISPECIES: hypothetical protein [Micromonospora]|uniref:Uncharacterized protein n=1 Tax=Micromonospora yangpuensis TaxID=683228 RepID=A0A1C6UK94_9ACTN|nr:hypothetical protein [Micromonospora yangpuensis]GGM16687.1 hypothetical protein GCM10012279_38490 [Micromonospora yangpuensis]SCL54368.1 hypothetical protein GA0070617_2646 [Micromonospora yangpuensis]